MRTLILLLFAIQAQGQVLPTLQQRSRVPQTVAPVNDTINVNFHKSTGGIGVMSTAGWNDVGWANGAVNPVSSTLNWADGTSSGITVSISQINDFNDNGSTWGDGNTMGFPALSFRAGLYNTGTPRTLTFANVPAGTYKLDIVSSRATTQTRPNTFTIGAITETVDAWNNLSNLVELDNIVHAGGSLTVTITHTQGFNFINALRLIRYED